MMIGEINQDNVHLLLPSKVSLLAGIIQQHEHIGLIEAIRTIYESEMYARLEDESTKLWHLGPVALYQEMKGCLHD